MRTFRFVTALFATVIASAFAFGQAERMSARRDVEAFRFLAGAISKMGALPPGDSIATGTVTVEAGSRVEHGTIRILTKGMSYTREEITVPSGVQNFIFAEGVANDNLNGRKAASSAELAASGQSAAFPLALLASAFATSDVAMKLVGTESLSGATTVHLRFWNTYGGNPNRQDLAKFSERDVWLDASTLLPVRIAYTQHTSSGASPGIAMAMEFSDFRSVGAVLYPFSIRKYVNGVLWATIQIQRVSFDTGLSAVDFKMP